MEKRKRGFRRLKYLVISIVIIAILPLIAAVVIRISGIGESEKRYTEIVMKSNELIDNIRTKYDGKEQSFSRLKNNLKDLEDKELDRSKLLVIDLGETLSFYAENDRLNMYFGDVINGFESHEVAAENVINDIINPGIKDATRLSDDILINAIGVTEETFSHWGLSYSNDTKTLFLPSNLIVQNSQKTLCFIQDDYYIYLPAKFFNAEIGSSDVTVTVENKKEENYFTVKFGDENNDKINYTSWEYPILVKINYEAPEGTDVIVERCDVDDIFDVKNKKRVARSYLVGDSLYLYAYTGGKYSFEEIPGSDEDNKYLKFIENREILDEEMLSNDIMTRADFMVALAKCGYSDISAGGNSKFTEDVSDNHKYIDEIITLQDRNVILGVGEGRLDPDGILTVQDMYVMMNRFINNFNVNLEGGIYPDNGKVNINEKNCSKYAVEHLYEMKRRGFILPEHIDNGYIEPKRAVKTAEAAEVLYMLITKGGGGLKHAKYGNRG